MYQKEYERLKGLVEENLLSFLPKGCKENQRLMESMTYSLEAGGKRIRPVLLLAACRMAGGEVPEALPFACALEYIHTYSLIHDDLPAMDDDDLRRGKPTNPKVFGEAAAILAGDGLLNAAFEIMLGEIGKTAAAGKGIERKIAAANIIAEAAGCGGMIGGQIADLESEHWLDSKDSNGRQKSDLQNQLAYIHAHKTGALIRGAVSAGACIGCAPDEMLADLDQYGEKLGLAFQIADDILDVCGDAEKMGKAVGSDVKHQKLTCPALLGLEESRALFLRLQEEAVNAIKKYGEKADFLIFQANLMKERTY